MPSIDLVIKQLSHSGQLLRTVTCPAGQVTVLRAYAPSDLKPFQRALAGASGAERFVITVGLNEYNSFEHILVGFGEQFLDEQESATDFLKSCGVPEDAVESTLTAYGLEHVQTISCKSLPQAEARMLRILGATHTRGKVIVLNDPFEAVHGAWRERYAELVLHFAHNSNGIVVVTALSSRPECWIDNERIVRVQVGESRQKTIGFSSAPSELRSEIALLRKELLEKPQIQPSGPLTAVVPAAVSMPTSEVPLASPAPQPVVAILKRTGAEMEASSIAAKVWKILKTPLPISPIAVSLLLGGVVLTFAYKSLMLREELRVGPPPGQTIAAVSTTEIPTPEPAAVLMPPKADPTSTPSLKPLPEKNKPVSLSQPLHIVPEVPTHARLLLDQYPMQIKQAVLAAFEGKNNSASPSSEEENSKPEAPTTSPKVGELLKMLETASETGSKTGNAGPNNAGEPPAAPEAEDSNDMSWEARREMMRQKFLESIQAASGEN